MGQPGTESNAGENRAESQQEQAMKTEIQQKRFTKDLQSYIFSRVSQMKYSTLKNQAAVCKSLSETNCGWLEYQLRNIILGVLENEIKLREKQNRSRQ